MEFFKTPLCTPSKYFSLLISLFGGFGIYLGDEVMTIFSLKKFNFGIFFWHR